MPRRKTLIRYSHCSIIAGDREKSFSLDDGMEDGRKKKRRERQKVGAK
jgi:hypothetical protein